MGFKVFPNPAETQIIIEHVNSDNGTVIEVYNAFGQLMISAAPQRDSNLTTIDISPLAAGLYYIRQGERVQSFSKD